MIGLSNFEYLSQIPATEANAATLQALTLQDVILGGWKNPTQLADPTNEAMVAKQLNRLGQNPENYSGYRQYDGSIVAFMKTNEWFRADEAPFAENVFARTSLRLKNGPMKPKALGVFGLAAEQSLERGDQIELIHSLLYRAIGQVAVQSAVVMNIVIHDKDPALSIASNLGLRPVGPKSEATGASGLMQQRFQKTI